MMSKIKLFFAPLREEFNKEFMIVNAIAFLGCPVISWLGKNTGSFLIYLGIIVLWWAIVALAFLTYKFIKQ